MILRDGKGDALLEITDAGGLRLPGARGDIRVHEGDLCYYRDGKHIGVLGSGTVEGAMLLDGDYNYQPLAYVDGVWQGCEILNTDKVSARVLTVQDGGRLDLGGGIALSCLGVEIDGHDFAWETLASSLPTWGEDEDGCLVGRAGASIGTDEAPVGTLRVQTLRADVMDEATVRGNLDADNITAGGVTARSMAAETGNFPELQPFAVKGAVRITNVSAAQIDTPEIINSLGNVVRIQAVEAGKVSAPSIHANTVDANRFGPMKVDENAVFFDREINAPNLKNMATKEQIARLREQQNDLLSRFELPPGGSVSFVVDESTDELVLVVRGSGRTRKYRLDLMD